MRERKSGIRKIALFFLPLVLLAACSGGGTQQAAAPADSAAGVWEVVGPGGGGGTFFPTYHPSDPTLMAIRCDMTGCYLSNDAGLSWKMYNIPGSVSAFAFDPTNKTTVYVGAAGLHRTTDFGKSWQVIFPVASDTLGRSYSDDHADFDWLVRDGASYPGGSSHVDAILIDPADPSTIFVGLNYQGAGSVFVTRDNGASWSELARLKDRVIGIYTGVDKAETLTAITRSTIATIDAASGDISEKELPEKMVPVESASGGVDPQSGAIRVYAVVVPRGTEAGGFGGEILELGGIYETVDAGANWSEISGPVAGLAEIPEDSVKPSYGWVATGAHDSRTAYVVVVHFADKNPRGEVGHWYGIVKTSDAGKSWAWVQKAGGGSLGYGVADAFKADNMLDSWVNDAFGDEFCRAICIGVFPADPNYATFTDWYRSMKTENGGGTWTALYSETLPDGSIRSRGLDVTTTYGVHFDPFNPDHIAISYTDIGYWHSYDRGKTWQRDAQGIPRYWHNTVYWLEFDPAVKDRVYSGWAGWHDLPKLKMIRGPRWKQAARGGFAISEDGGKSWTVSSEGLPDDPVTWVVLDPKSPPESRTIYATSFGSGVYKSVDGGKSWVEASNGIGENRNVFQLSLDANGSLWLVTTFDVNFGGETPVLVDGAVYRSDDGAASWHKVELPAGVRFPNTIESDPLDPNQLYLACWSSVDRGDFRGGSGSEESEGGVLASSDNGQTWTQVYDPKSYVYAVAADPRQAGRVYLNTFMHHAAFSTDFGQSWKRIAGYNFHWGHRPIPDLNSKDAIYLTTFGGSVFHGTPVAAE